MRRYALLSLIVLFTLPLAAQTADEIIAKYIKTIGGSERLNAITSIRRTGKYTAGGGFEAPISQENKRPNKVREEFTMQGLTGVTAYDGSSGWKIEPWEGKKDAESLSEDELKDILDDADFDGPLVNYKEKGYKVEYAGLEPVEGTDAYKLKLTGANGDIRYYFMDTDYYVPIKIELKRMIRGAEREFEQTLGDYKEVGGVYFPHSIETNPKGNPNRAKWTFEKIETNVAFNEGRFVSPAVKK
jgi:outer membrane lipoprotein-sorting protein